MIEHLVLFRFKPETTELAKTIIVKELQALRSLIPGIVDLSMGRNFTDRSQGYEYGLVLRFKDRQGLEVYQSHPEHQRVIKEFIRPALADIIALDYEFQGQLP